MIRSARSWPLRAARLWLRGGFPGSFLAHGHALLGLETRDDVLERPGGSTLAFEIKRSAAPRASRGLLTAMQDLGLRKAHVVCPVRERFTLAAGVEWDALK